MEMSFLLPVLSFRLAALLFYQDERHNIQACLLVNNTPSNEVSELISEAELLHREAPKISATASAHAGASRHQVVFLTVV